MTKYDVFRPIFTPTEEKLFDGRSVHEVTMVRQASVYADSDLAAMAAAKSEGIRAPIVAPSRV